MAVLSWWSNLSICLYTAHAWHQNDFLVFTVPLNLTKVIFLFMVAFYKRNVLKLLNLTFRRLTKGWFMSQSTLQTIPRRIRRRTEGKKRRKAKTRVMTIVLITLRSTLRRLPNSMTSSAENRLNEMTTTEKMEKTETQF